MSEDRGDTMGNPLSTGDVVDGRFEVVHEIGRGGYAIVYRAKDLKKGRDVALKIMHPSGPDSDDIVERFKREVVLASQLEHANTVQVFQYGINDELYLAMELLEGHSLTEELNGREGIPVERAVAIGCAILASLSEAHALGIVHRDIKPENIFLAEDSWGRERVKVLDFGIAKLTGDAQREHNLPNLTMMGRAMGTPTYMSPEQAQARELTAASDIYAVGVLLYELIEGVPPFHGGDAMQVMLRHVNEPPPHLTVHGLTGSLLDQALQKAMQKDPEDRFADARGFLTALRAS